MVLHLCASTLARGLFAAAIVQSGATFNTLDPAGARVPRRRAARRAGHRRPPPAPRSAGRRADPAQSAARWRCCSGRRDDAVPPDGRRRRARRPARPTRSRAGAAAGVPLVVGTTTDEMRLFLDLAFHRRRVTAWASASSAPRASTARAPTRSSRRTSARSAPTTPTRSGPPLFADHEMQVPADAMLDAHAAHGPRTPTASRAGARSSARATASTSRSRSATSSTAGPRSSAPTTRPPLSGRTMRATRGRGSPGTGDPGWPRRRPPCVRARVRRSSDDPSRGTPRVTSRRAAPARPRSHRRSAAAAWPSTRSTASDSPRATAPRPPGRGARSSSTSHGSMPPATRPLAPIGRAAAARRDLLVRSLSEIRAATLGGRQRLGSGERGAAPVDGRVGQHRGRDRGDVARIDPRDTTVAGRKHEPPRAAA